MDPSQPPQTSNAASSAQSTPSARATIRPLSGASSARLASLKSAPAALLPRVAPKTPAEGTQPRRSSETESQPLLSTRDLLSQARATPPPTPKAGPAGTGVSGPRIITSAGGASQRTPWKTEEGNKMDLSGTEVERGFRTVAFKGERNLEYRPQALPLSGGGKGEEELQLDLEVQLPRERELFLMQLPRLLPTFQGATLLEAGSGTSPKKNTKSRKILENKKTVVGTKLHDLPDGRIGNLVVRKSGKISMVIGNLEFDVTPGSLGGFRSEAAFLSPTDGEVIFLGPVTNKLIVSPVLDAQLEA